MKVLICYSSKTGNTKKIAEAIGSICPFEYDFIDFNSNNQIDWTIYDLIFVGYWVENSKADSLTIEFLNQIKNKRIALFGTSGTDPNHSYVKSVFSKTEKELDNTNELIGHFICQGEIAKEVIDNFEFIVKAQPDNKIMAALLNIFKEQYPISIGHPNELDLINAKKYFKTILDSLQ